VEKVEEERELLKHAGVFGINHHHRKWKRWRKSVSY